MQRVFIWSPFSLLCFHFCFGFHRLRQTWFFTNFGDPVVPCRSCTVCLKDFFLRKTWINNRGTATLGAHCYEGLLSYTSVPIRALVNITTLITSALLLHINQLYSSPNNSYKRRTKLDSKSLVSKNRKAVLIKGIRQCYFFMLTI